MYSSLRTLGSPTIQSPMMRGARQSKPAVFIGMCGNGT